MPAEKFFVEGWRTDRYALSCKQCLCIYKGSRQRLLAMPETATFACWKYPKPFEQPRAGAGCGSASLIRVRCHFGMICNFPDFQNLAVARKEKRRNGAQPQMAICEKGVWGRCHQQAKTGFRRSRRKLVLSICGNKYTACKVAIRYYCIVLSNMV